MSVRLLRLSLCRYITIETDSVAKLPTLVYYTVYRHYCLAVPFWAVFRFLNRSVKLDTGANLRVVSYLRSYPRVNIRSR